MDVARMSNAVLLMDRTTSDGPSQARVPDSYDADVHHKYTPYDDDMKMHRDSEQALNSTPMQTLFELSQATPIASPSLMGRRAVRLR
jgi:hypothetical protein